MTALIVGAALAGYLLGAISPATIVARRHGVDLHAVGSGNPGATNVGRVLGRRTGVAVALVDIAKGFLPAAAFGAADHRAGLVAGLAAVAGHTTSPFLRGKGGKGVATAGGAVLGSHPAWAPVVIATWLVVLVVSRWTALASMAAALTVPVLAVVLGEDLLWAAVLAVVVVVRHRSNLLRRRGEAGGADPLAAD